MRILKPARNRVLLRQLESVAPHGTIVIPDVAQEKCDVYEVVSIGDVFDEKNRPIESWVKSGDKVIFENFNVTKRTIEGVEYTLIPHADIVATVAF
jgi:co-chaperonin GroES (HSP10)